VTKKVRVGDVFIIPIEDTRYGIGQIAGASMSELYLVIYDKVVEADVTPNALDGASVKFAALSLDAKLYYGDWPVIGNRLDNIATIPQPWFKVKQNGSTYVEARDRSVFRPATALEERALRLRSVVAPIRLEKALKAQHGLGEWNSSYDELTAEYASESASLTTANDH
jgi:hypothetical protein